MSTPVSPALPPETPQELAVKADFHTNVWSVFQNLYEDRWDQARWNAAIARFGAAHDPAAVQRFWTRAKLPSWDALEAQFRKGPPPFLRPGWVSPLLGKRVDLRWLDSGRFEHVQGSMDGWRDAKVLIIELWASYVCSLPRLSALHGARRAVCTPSPRTPHTHTSQPCVVVFDDLSRIAQTRPEIKVITFNSETIFTNAPVDVGFVKNFVASRTDMKYPIFIDTHRVAVNSIFQPGQNLSIPLVFIITPNDSVVRWIGNPEEMAVPLEDIVRRA
ncbi:uncharacterized protein BXZ73DRAFT_37922 [Epithele typhae]|uniref:uncharacterized protein n=1 Tax=Epithele typhae TaxID=378194 RepID=UPI00200739BA|nr:uncharacterized protein BXZ73DRAFT_37922 [Epithele typhae]KAH9945284.1 hypothetical protein BXZ73DRAFT_37922 [Epithele typhae]